MKAAKDFYNQLHETQGTYSAGTYHMASLWKNRALRRWLSERRGKEVRLLDVGCGKGLFLRDFVHGALQGWGVTVARVTGIDLVQSPGNLFSEISPNFEFKLHNGDGEPLPFTEASYDFISCNHVLEHVFETEALVREFRRVLRPGGLCIISVPNVAAWVNRVMFLWGNPPLGTEIGTERNGYGFRPTFLQKKLDCFKPSGHIRDFTPRGLKDLVEHCGFETLGWWPQSHGVLARLGKWSGRNMSILATPRI
jgi:ubiquinone/menaquinone biosynthesis C-methylase UbiE